MLVLILILALVVLAGLSFAVAIWFVSRYRMKSEAQPAETASSPAKFRWKYITAPLAILILSIVVSALFYPRLPTEVGYRFGAGGTPDRWMSREAAVALMIVPQLLLLLLSRGMISGMARLGFGRTGSEKQSKSERIFMLMGNISALPLAILAFVMVDIFSYNSYNIRIMPGLTWAAMLGIAAVVLGALLIFVIQKMRRSLT